MRNIAIIPARSGSKGLPDKNIKLLHNKPMMAYTIEAARKSNMFDEIMVSTDSEKYADIAIQFGANVPFLRSEELSGDIASSWDVVKEVLNNYAIQGQRFDTVCLLQPTSPLRNDEDIRNGYKVLNATSGDAVTSVCETDHSPLWCMKLEASNSLNEFRKGIVSQPRQKMEKYYRLNGALYIRKIEYGVDGANIADKDEYAYIMDKAKSVDIDCELDFKIAEILLEK